MKVKLSDHAKSQRVERKIPLEQILKTVKSPKNKAGSFKIGHCYKESLVIKYWK